MRPTKPRPLDLKLEALRRIRQDPASEQSNHGLRRLLLDKSWLVVSEAARIVSEHRLENVRDSVAEVWPRFVENGAKTDPGCRAKEAALTALDALELLDPQPFLTAIRYRQLESVAGGKVDTAGGLRVRALYALFRMGHPDAALWAGQLMADPDPQVRAAVARGLGTYGDRTSAALLVLKLGTGDEDPVVSAECAASLLATAHDYALELLGSLLSGSDEVLRETAALALAQSNRADCVVVLLGWLERAAYDRDLDLGIRALGLSRLEPARTHLLHVVETGGPGRARAAVEALAVHHYDKDLLARVRTAARANRSVDLKALVERCFRSGSES